MEHSTKHERGQALILIVFAIVGMVGLTALAIDGGNAYSDRRHAQNAADTAALAAALSKINGADQATWTQAGLNIAATNGYSNGANATVSVNSCSPQPDPPCVLGAGEDPTKFVQVVIQSTVRTYFAPVVGIRWLTNTVQAIAKAVPEVKVPWYNGNALVSLMPGCKQGGGPFPFEIGGNQTTSVHGTGVFVNSKCSSAFYQNGASSSMNAPGVCVVGGAAGAVVGVNPPPTYNCGQQIDMQMYTQVPLGPTSCDSEGNGKVDDLGGGNYYAHAGNYNGTFPPVSNGNLKIGQGIYCLHNGFSVTGNMNMTTDTNGDGIYEVSEGALFYVEGGGVSIGGNGSVYLHSITTTSTGLGPDLVGYLMYVPVTNGSSVSLTGGSDTTYVGTILAPGSLITLSGGSGTGNSLNLQTQIIGEQIKLTGSGNLNITYNQSQNAMTYQAPQLTPYK